MMLTGALCRPIAFSLFHVTVSFHTPLKTSESLWFSNVFKGQRKRKWHEMVLFFHDGGSCHTETSPLISWGSLFIFHSYTVTWLDSLVKCNLRYISFPEYLIVIQILWIISWTWLEHFYVFWFCKHMIIFKTPTF